MANPISDFIGSITAPVTLAFNEIGLFLIRAQIVGLNIVEVLLFVLFFAVLIALMVFPARLYGYYKTFSEPFNRFFRWVRN